MIQGQKLLPRARRVSNIQFFIFEVFLPEYFVNIFYFILCQTLCSHKSDNIAT